MLQNKEDLKNKIIYRASYRGTKEMDILMIAFVKSLINTLDIDNLIALDKISSFNFVEVSIFFFILLKALKSKHFNDKSSNCHFNFAIPNLWAKGTNISFVSNAISFLLFEDKY